MAEGLTIYSKNGNKIDVYKVYSRADVRYMAKFVLTDEEGNKVSRSFPWHDTLSDKGMFWLKKAFEGRGSTAIIVTEIEEMHKKFKEMDENGFFKQQTTQIGLAASIPNNLIKQQLELWYTEAIDRNEAISYIKDLEKQEKKVAMARDTVKKAESDKQDESETALKKAENELEKLNHVYSLECYVSVEDIANNRTDTADNSNIPILVREVKGEDQILYILVDSLKKWIELLGVPYSSFKKKMINNNIMYNPSSTSNPRFHFTSSCPWYYGICINMLDRMDFMV